MNTKGIFKAGALSRIMAPAWAYVLLLSFAYPQTGSWSGLSFSGTPTKRHEGGFVQVGDQFLLIGGRQTNNRIQAFDPLANTWANRAELPPDPANPNKKLVIHHVQPVVVDGLVYLIGAFTGGFPSEVPLNTVIIYDPVSDQWLAGPQIPANRLRGAAGAVAYQGKIYLFCGIQNGHLSGWVPWVDVYDPATNTWAVLSPAPVERDHFQAVRYGHKVYLAGGRRTHYFGNTFTGMVPQIDVYDLLTDTWTTLTDTLPTPRGGTYSAVFQHPAHGDVLATIGGETSRLAAYREMEGIKLSDNSVLPPGSLANLNQARHATQVVANGNRLFIAAGAGPDRGGNEIEPANNFFVETYSAGNSSVLSLPPITRSSLQTPAGQGLSFGSTAVGSESHQTLSLPSITGNQGLYVSQITLSGADAAAFELDLPFTLPVVIPPGQALTFDLIFRPNSTLAATNAQVDIVHRGANGPLTAVSLLGSSPGPAPVEWLSVSAEVVSDLVWVRWATAREVNHAGFAVEHAGADQVFQAFEQLPARQANRDSVTQYEVAHRPWPGQHLYRIKQWDLDGTTSYSPVVRVQVSRAFPPRIQPNPVRRGQPLEVSWYMEKKGPAQVQLVSLRGETVLQIQLNQAAGEARTVLATSHLVPGIYLLSLRQHGHQAPPAKVLIL